uniref:Uncharacterized protein n=1 Tax=Anguilla anguilla TaxID=7936 RepID=A0A0E9RXX8_ANGAN
MVGLFFYSVSKQPLPETWPLGL